MADTPQVLPNTKNDLIIERVQRELKAKAQAAPFVSDYSAFAVKGAKSINVPRLTSFGVTNRAFGSAADATALTDATDVINLDFNAYVAWLEDHRDNYQSTIQYRLEASMRAASAHGRNVDGEIYSVAEAAAYDYVNAGPSTAPITKDDVIELRRKLLLQNAMIENMSMHCGIDQEAALLKIDDFVRADSYGSSNIPDGRIGSLYGIPVFISNLIDPAQVHMWDKEGIGLAFQEGVQISEQRANEYGAESFRVAMDQLFGVDALQLGVDSGKGDVAVGGSASPLIVKLQQATA